MSVLINMEMPTNCSDCPMCGLYGEHKGDVHRCDITFYPVKYEDGLNKRHKSCPLVPVPEHGRLIDADEFFKALTMDDRVSILEAMHVQSILSDATTIIPAEPPKEETE